MELQTKVALPVVAWRIEPCEPLLCVGSCFANNIGQRFRDEAFPAEVNPYGVMYNPLSVLHTIERVAAVPRVVVLSLGTNHVYIDKTTGSVADNCQKRPAAEFVERVLTVEECYDALCRCVEHCGGQVVVTVSPIRYKKYGYHGSQLSKATLLLAAEQIASTYPARVTYFPSYEIVNDELRDYRFYAPDMLHPSPQTIDYLFCCFVETFFSDEAKAFLRAWQPLKAALAHRPQHPNSDDYLSFLADTKRRVLSLRERYPRMLLPADII